MNYIYSISLFQQPEFQGLTVEGDVHRVVKTIPKIAMWEMSTTGKIHLQSRYSKGFRTHTQVFRLPLAFEMLAKALDIEGPSLSFS